MGDHPSGVYDTLNMTLRLVAAVRVAMQSLDSPFPWTALQTRTALLAALRGEE
jgi:hypothetical protein